VHHNRTKRGGKGHMETIELILVFVIYDEPVRIYLVLAGLEVWMYVCVRIVAVVKQMIQK
jgi:hypothetical protein